MKNEVQTMRLIDAPVGLLEFDGTVILKTEYMTRRADGSVVPDCYIVESGEYFCGGVETAEELKNLEVTQVSLDSYGERHFPDLTKMAPLTLEQLREMDGEVVLIGDSNGIIAEKAFVRAERGFLSGQDRTKYYFECLGKTYFAYAYPPAYIDREAWTAEWKDHYKSGVHAGTGAICSSCDAWNERKTHICPFCGKAMDEDGFAMLEKRMGVR